MQFLLRVALEDTSLWRLCALDGRADLAHTAALICASFGYQAGTDSFAIDGRELTAGHGGQPGEACELAGFESSLGAAVNFVFRHRLSDGTVLSHRAQVMKAEEKLSCLVPSVIVGSGAVPKQEPYDAVSIQSYADEDEHLQLDIKAATASMRTLGSVRGDVSDAMVSAGAVPLNFKLG